MANLNLIRVLCSEKKMSLKELAEKIGVTPHGIQNILRTGSTKLETLEKIAEVLEVPLSDFFYGRTTPIVETFFPTQYILSSIARMASERYDKFSTKINLHFDFYIDEMSNFSGHLDKVIYPLNHPDKPDYLFKDTPHIEFFFEKYNSLKIIPFSKLGKDLRISFSRYPLLFEAFFIPIFALNYFGVNEYMDELIKELDDSNKFLNQYLITYWNDWKILSKNIAEPDISPFIKSMRSFPDDSI